MTKFCIFYEDTDVTGAAYHTSHLKFAERARSLLLKKNFKTLTKQIENKEFHFVVKEINIDYKNPAFLFEELKVETFFKSNGKTYLSLKQVIKSYNKIICDIHVKLVWIASNTHKPSKLPNDLISRFKLMEIV